MDNGEEDNKYCYKGTNVLINKFDIRNNEVLSTLEMDFSSLRYENFQTNPIKGIFDIKHIKAIHKNLFQDIYTWAGEFRTVNIGKGNLFCLVENIESYLGGVLDGLAKENYLIGVARVQRIEKLAVYFGDINAAHPFREGNGRTQRAFIELLGKVNGLDIDFSKTTEKLMLSANVSSFNGSDSELKRLFKNISTPISKTQQLRYCKQILPQSVYSKVIKRLRTEPSL
ncbi:MAG: Fic family protein [Defluviitaleaceae bacterium]|nr:Fic family protein [Defluviitaleaceae bacterium]